MTNTGLGLSLFSNKEYSRFSDFTLVWMFIAYIAIVTLINIKMYFFTKFDSKKTSGMKKSTYTKLEEEEEENLINANKDNKKMNEEKERDSTYRWMFLGVFLILNVAFVFIFVVLVALPK